MRATCNARHGVAVSTTVFVSSFEGWAPSLARISKYWS
jgi:hypothetical protein